MHGTAHRFDTEHHLVEAEYDPEVDAKPADLSPTQSWYLVDAAHVPDSSILLGTTAPSGTSRSNWPRKPGRPIADSPHVKHEHVEPVLRAPLGAVTGEWLRLGVALHAVGLDLRDAAAVAVARVLAPGQQDEHDVMRRVVRDHRPRLELVVGVRDDDVPDLQVW